MNPGVFILKFIIIIFASTYAYASPVNWQRGLQPVQVMEFTPLYDTFSGVGNFNVTGGFLNYNCTFIMDVIFSDDGLSEMALSVADMRATGGLLCNIFNFTIDGGEGVVDHSDIPNVIASGEDIAVSVGTVELFHSAGNCIGSLNLVFNDSEGLSVPTLMLDAIDGSACVISGTLTSTSSLPYSIWHP